MEVVLGSGKYRYERVEGWARPPEYFEVGMPTDVAVDSRDRVFVFCRGNHPVLIFDRDGSFISCWGEGHFVNPHAIHIAPDDSVYLTDDQTHTVEKFTPGGKLLMTLGTRNRTRPIFLRVPFNQPAAMSLAPSGEMFVADGNGNFLVHRFSATGELLKTWGEPGKGPGQFSWPHYIGVDRHGTVYVCDRRNGRVQTFAPNGEFITQWTGMSRPSALYIDRQKDVVYVLEGGDKKSAKTGLPRVSIRDLTGGVLSSFEGWEEEGGVFGTDPHGIGVDSRGDIYVTEAGTAPRIQKFARLD